MDKIHIVNWLLTRRCTLKCDYCRLIRNYDNMPYPNMKYYHENEISTDRIITCLKKVKLHNPNCFNIFYGGEPILRTDLPEIINYCNKENINYTIISNNTYELQPRMKTLFEKVDYIEGFTASIDPIIYQNRDNDIFKKSFLGFERLKEYSSIIKDVVAEITVTNDNLDYLYLLVRDLTDNGINSDITFVDISKSVFYDFSNVEDKSLLVQKSQKLRDILGRIIDEDLNVHMKETLLMKIYETLPSEFDCEIEKNFHNMTIDADGALRTCLRIRGIATPSNMNIDNVIDNDGNVNEYLKHYISWDKSNYCKLCQWSCPIMSKMIMENEDNHNNLIHSDIRC